MSHPTPTHGRDVRARAHIKALIEEMKEQADGAPGPVQSFVSGMLSGLAASVEILDGGTAEGSLEKMEQRLAAAIGKAYLDGKLPPRPPNGPETSVMTGPAASSALREQLATAVRSVLYQELPGDMGLHVTDAVLAVILPNTRIVAGLTRDACTDINRVTALYERWVKAGPPPLGTSLSRWWDARLAELHAAILGPDPRNSS